MTDHEFKLALAKVCGYPIVHSRLGASTYPCVLECTPWLCILLEKEVGPDAEPWNPVEDWRQVHKYVIPALRARGCEVFMGFESDEGGRAWVTVERSLACIADKRIAMPVGDAVPSRLVCEAALEAAGKLEATV